MTIKRLDHLSVVVDDLAVAIAFFTGLGMTLEGEMPVEGPVGGPRKAITSVRAPPIGVNGIESVQGDIVMRPTSDGHERLEL